MDVFLIIVVIILSLLLLVINLYLMVAYTDPQEKFTDTVWPRIVIILGLTLCWAQVLLLPLDVSNTRHNGGLDMTFFWILIYIIIAIFVFFLIPFTMFYYETDDEASNSERMCTAVKFQFIYLIVFGSALLIMYGTIAEAVIPVVLNSCPIAKAVALGDTSLPTNADRTVGCKTFDRDITMPVSFPIYLMAFMAFVGWILFVIFGGIGLSALPMDLIREYQARPTFKITLRYLDNKKTHLRDESSKLLAFAREIKEEKQVADTKGGWAGRRMKSKANSKLRKLKAAYFLMEKEMSKYKTECNYRDLQESQFTFFLKLILGCFCVLMSILWVLHIILFRLIVSNGAPAYPFLNNMLIGLDNANLSMLATTLFGFFALYLLWCTVKGNFKFGLRLFLCCPIHPMKRGETLLNSFLFNVMLILICSVAITQFCYNCFSYYARLTSADLLFGAQIKYLKFFNIFWDEPIFAYILIGWSFVTMIYLLFKPVDEIKLPGEGQADRV
eukprot:CAMPEP_0115005264 /NCGR_PEP_ID=MMETSP0216-20121206/19751_1 /TAXON_ID=223996 /ORGANISM="Protocruzia adherens, Strain Boccale" /LENGTH=499 /DNA_ID=CAMNT_0002371523 /DNA_START=100 /DNA_END=1599 /DNA_ORIENTATION=+